MKGTLLAVYMDAACYNAGMQHPSTVLRRLWGKLCAGCVWFFILFAVVSCVWSLVVAFTTVFDTVQYELQDTELRKSGWHTTAEVLSAEQTRVYYNEAPEIAIALRVRMLSGAIVDVHTKWFVQLIDLPKMQPGSTVQVIVDPKDPAKIIRE